MTLARSCFGCLLLPGVLAAQAATAVARTGVTFESYSFGSGLAFDRLSELTIPVSVSPRIAGGRRVLGLSTAFARASVTPPGGGAASLTRPGLADTDRR